MVASWLSSGPIRARRVSLTEVYHGFECVTLSIVVRYVKFGFRENSLSDSMADRIRDCTLFHTAACANKERAYISALPQGMDGLICISILGSEVPEDFAPRSVSCNKVTGNARTR